MKVVIQRVKKAECRIDGKIISQIGKGLLIFVGIEQGDEIRNAKKLANKCGNLRIFEDREGKMNFSLKEIGGEILVISQFTLCADCDKGLRPSFDRAYSSGEASILYKKFIELLAAQDIQVKEGIFGKRMSISLVNEGPATFILSS